MAEPTFHDSIIEEFRANGGVVTRPYPDSTLVLVTMQGARTGRRMTLPLEYLELDGVLHIFATAGGAPDNPAWYHKAGLGMADTLRLTQQCPFGGGGCYTITDRGTLQQLTHNRAITRLRPVMDNQAARPVRYQKTAWAGHTSRKSLASTTMIYSGLTIFLLVLIHLKQFKFGAMYEIGDPPVRDLYRTEVEVFSQPGWVVLYVIFVGLVAAHLRHGISSAVQSLGITHPVYTKRIVLLGTILAIVIGAGFAIIPIWVLLTR